MTLSLPIPFLQETNIVDTPGTNAVIRQHEEITQDFIPRSDLVLFVTSADRPFTESERAFLERIRQWGKKVLVVINKIDIIEAEEEIDKVVDSSKTTAAPAGFRPGSVPDLFQVALRQDNADEPAQRLWQRSRFEPLERYILETLDQNSRVRSGAQSAGIAEPISSTAKRW